MAFKFRIGDIVHADDGRSQFIGKIITRYRAFPDAERKYHVSGQLHEKGDYLESQMAIVNDSIVFRNLTRGFVYMTSEEGIKFLAEHPTWSRAVDGIHVASNCIDKHNKLLNDELSSACVELIKMIKQHDSQAAIDAEHQIFEASTENLVDMLSKLIDIVDVEICDPYEAIYGDAIIPSDHEFRLVYQRAHAILRRFNRKECN